MDDKTCCKSLQSGGPSPFDIVILGWYDGLKSGMASCRACGAAYHFEMLAWDSEHEMRIYGLRLVSRSSYEAIAALAAQAPPQPAHLRARLDEMALLVRDALATSYEWSLYIRTTDLSKEVLAVKRIDFWAWHAILAL